MYILLMIYGYSNYISLYLTGCPNCSEGLKTLF